ncbi:MAG: alpha/beta hydrolase [Comamonadaceae bacterium]|nr:MAG: alpha/beta hydrolase [Comamonadaceae bacterium]
MLEPSLHHVQCPDADGGHRMAFWQWGAPAGSHVVLCVHGLTRQGRDFDSFARGLLADAEKRGVAGELRIVCPDVAGRGRSDWLADPMGYQIPVYAADMLALVGQLQADASVAMLDWVGTSMGGLIGIVVAGQPAGVLPVPVRRLVLNDVGPALEWSAIERIGAYLGQAGHFDSLQQAADAMWAISSSFGPHTAQEWLALSRHMLLPVDESPSSKLRLHYDPALGVPFRAGTEETTRQGEILLWQFYDNIAARTLVVRGAQSDLLSPATAESMRQRGPKAGLVEFAGVGHAPTLVAKDQIHAVAGFLLEA